MPRKSKKNTEAGDSTDAKPAGFTPAIGRVVHVRSPLFGRRAHDAQCEAMLDATDGDRAKVKLPAFEPGVRPGRILRVHGGDKAPTAVDVVVDIDPECDLVAEATMIVREQPVFDREPKASGDVVVFAPPRK